MYRFLQVTTLVPTDPQILQRMGELYDDISDHSQAYQYHYESFRYCPTNIDVISWLGAYYMESQFADKAIHYFEKAALIQPTQINWQLMVASCYRKIGQSIIISMRYLFHELRTYTFFQGITNKHFNATRKYTESFLKILTV